MLNHWRTSVVVLALAGASVACRDRSTKPPPVGPNRIEPLHETVQVKPGMQVEVPFRLLTDEMDPQAVAGEEVRFSLVDDPSTPEDEAHGATLASDRDVTGPDGVARALVTAGLEAIFPLRAQAPRADDKQTVVFVGAGDFGSLEVVIAFAPGSSAPTVVASVDTIFYDGQPCTAVSRPKPPPSVRLSKTIPVDGTTTYDSINMAADHALLGRGRDASGMARAQGCVDLPGKSLVPGALVRVPLVLADLRPSPLGSFSVSSRFTFDKPPIAGAALAAPWSDLSDCPLDPAQLWIDCTLDAVSGETATDPIDCKPQDEGILGLRLATRRGVVGPGGCRSSMDAAGGPSNDGLVANLFPSPRPALLGALPGLGADAAALFETVKLESVLTLRATTTPGRDQADHQLRTLEVSLGKKAGIRIDLPSLALPALTAESLPAVEQGGELSLTPHGMTLRLGTVARGAFGDLALKPRGLPRTSQALVDGIVALASRAGQGGVVQKGCAALDAVLCSEVGEPMGCVVIACAAGVAAWARHLDSGFDAMDGDDLDLFLDGSAVIIDGDADGFADRLGDTTAVPGRPGIWSAEIHGRAGATAKFAGTWSAARR